MTAATRPSTGHGGTVALGMIYVIAVFACPVVWIVLWIEAFGFSTPVDLATPAAVPGWLALATAPLIGLILGWVAPTAPAPRSWTLVLAPSVPMAIAIVAYVTRGYGAPIEDSILAWFGIVALYSYGPVALGRGLRIASIRLRGLGT